MGMGRGDRGSTQQPWWCHSLSSKIPTPEVRLNRELALNLVYFSVKTGFY